MCEKIWMVDVSSRPEVAILDPTPSISPSVMFMLINIKLVFIEHLLYMRHCACHWRYKGRGASHCIQETVCPGNRCARSSYSVK